MQASETTLEMTLGSKSTMEELFGPSKTRIDFVDNGTITKKQNMLQEIGQQLLSSKHTLFLVNSCIWPLI
jgi:hypothetical protein